MERSSCVPRLASLADCGFKTQEWHYRPPFQWQDGFFQLWLYELYVSRPWPYRSYEKIDRHLEQEAADEALSGVSGILGY